MINIKNLYKSYISGNKKHIILQELNFYVEKGDFIALMGQSGTGKSTLLNIIGLLDNYDAGDYYLNDINIKALSKNQINKFRNQLIGFIFQKFYLIPFKTVIDNVALPLYYQGVQKKDYIKRTLNILDKVGLSPYAFHKPTTLSGGQQQKVAIARALITSPPLIIADEPTGSLDHNSANEIMDLLKEMNKNGHTILIVTHSPHIAQQCNCVKKLIGGKIV